MDGKTLVSYGQDDAILLWEVATGKERGRLTGKAVSLAALPPARPRPAPGRLTARQGKPVSLAFSADDSVLAAAYEDGTVRPWELLTGKTRREFKGHQARVTAVAFSPSGEMLASASEDTTVLLWKTAALVPGGQAASAGFKGGQLDTAWAELAGDDASRAYRTLTALVAAPRQAVPFLKAHLQPAEKADARRIRRLIADLDSDRFGVRQRATKELEAVAELAAPVLRQALAQRPSPEVRRRAEGLLARLDSLRPEQVRGVRAVEVLEHIGTPEAQDILDSLARGTPEARLTQEAKTSLERLARRATFLHP